jgi:glyoxylase-like metal-dependent hydrolase (beta-lactamase superfamily II)
MEHVNPGATGLRVGVGDLSLTCVHDSDIHLSPEALFLDWDDGAANAVAASLGRRYYDPVRRVHTLPVNCWVLRDGASTVLVDTGCGDLKWRPDLPELHLLRTGFLERLEAAGVRPEDVDLVLCTHLHADHVGWNTRLQDGRCSRTASSTARS